MPKKMPRKQKATTK
jgi:hypothetical protein